MRVHYYYQSNIGNFREKNEDNLFINGVIRPINEQIFEREGIAKFINSTYGVFDGMGGESCGEQASYIAAKTLKKYKKSRIEVEVNEFLQDANEHICDYTVSENLSRCGSTAALIQFRHGVAQATNIGDSRVYFFRGGKLRQLTHDHTEYQQKIDIGVDAEGGAVSPSLKSVLTQFLGLFPDEMILEPYSSKKIAVKAGDIFMLCSDGLYGKQSMEDLEEQFNNMQTLAELGKSMIRSALDRRERDNITVALIEVISEEITYSEIFTETLNQWKMKLKRN